MTLTEIILIIVSVLIIINILLTLFKKSNSISTELKDEFTKTNTSISNVYPLIRNEFSTNREEAQTGLKNTREELNNSFKNFGDSLTKTIKENRTELSDSLKSFEDKFTLNIKDFNDLQRQKFSDLLLKQEKTKTDTEAKLEKIRETLDL